MIGMRLGERPREKVKISKEFSGISAGLCGFISKAIAWSVPADFLMQIIANF